MFAAAHQRATCTAQVKSGPTPAGLYVALLKKELKLLTLPARLTLAGVRAAFCGGMGPLGQQISDELRLITQTREQAQKIGTMLIVLLSDSETYEMLSDFAKNYRQNTHPLERTEIGAAAFSDAALTIVLALLSAGIGAAGSIATKSRHITRAFELLETISDALKRTGTRHHLPKKPIDAGTGSAKAAKAKQSLPEPIDSSAKKKRPKKGDAGGPKTTKPVADKKFKRKHLDGDPKDPYTLMPDGKPMGAKEGVMPSEFKLYLR